MKTIATLVAVFFASLLQAQTLNKIVVFGDSLSDNGNLYHLLNEQVPASPPYFAGRFSNGPVWAEYLAELCAPAQNILEDRAYGGAGILLPEQEDYDSPGYSLRREMVEYLRDNHGTLDADNLYVIWIGSNNYLNIPEDPDAEVSQVQGGIQAGIEELLVRGARYIMLVNQPDLGSTPVAKEFDAVDVLRYMTLRHNSVCEQIVADFSRQYPDKIFMLMDTNAILSEFLSTPEQFGFVNIDGSCLDDVANLEDTSICDGYIFFDPIHPTTRTHRVLAERAFYQLMQNNLDFGNYQPRALQILS